MKTLQEIQAATGWNDETLLALIGDWAESNPAMAFEQEDPERPDEDHCPDTDHCAGCGAALDSWKDYDLDGKTYQVWYNCDCGVTTTHVYGLDSIHRSEGSSPAWQRHSPVRSGVVA